jgi:hypothetical protein
MTPHDAMMPWWYKKLQDSNDYLVMASVLVLGLKNEVGGGGPESRSFIPPAMSRLTWLWSVQSFLNCLISAWPLNVWRLTLWRWEFNAVYITSYICVTQNLRISSVVDHAICFVYLCVVLSLIVFPGSWVLWSPPVFFFNCGIICVAVRWGDGDVEGLGLRCVDTWPCWSILSVDRW